jgi:hypothetical protein
LFVEHFRAFISFSTAVNARQVLEEQPRAVKEGQERPVTIPRQRIEAGLNIGEVRAKQSRHVAIKPLPVWKWRARLQVAFDYTGSSSRPSC